MEKMISTVSPETSSTLIDEESDRLEEVRLEGRLSQNDFVDYVLRHSRLSLSEVREAISRAKSGQLLVRKLKPKLNADGSSMIEECIKEKDEDFLVSINKARYILSLKAIDFAAPRKRKKPAPKKKKSKKAK